MHQYDTHLERDALASLSSIEQISLSGADRTCENPLYSYVLSQQPSPSSVCYRHRSTWFEQEVKTKQLTKSVVALILCSKLFKYTFFFTKTTFSSEPQFLYLSPTLRLRFSYLLLAKTGCHY